MKQSLKFITFFLLSLLVMNSCNKEENVAPVDASIKHIEGAIQSVFSVSDSTQVYFSMGNLQYQASTKTWRFAEHQYDTIGKYGNYKRSQTYDGWIDRFGWGTSGYKGKNPYMTSTDDRDYGIVEDSCADIAGTNYDWGVYNAIQNGGNSAGMWRTLTNEEWNYVLSQRTNASSLKGSATVNGVTGMILLPDNWTTPAGITFTNGMNGFNSNTYTTSEWAKMESNGAVFLPIAGSRIGTNVYHVGSYGYCWSASRNYRGVYYLDFGSDYAYMYSGSGRSHGQSVRLVREVNSNTDSGDTGNTSILENGAIKAAFLVSDSTQVNFSMGNLQYQASTNTWRFAENQYDIIGNNNSNISSTYSDYIDLFGWGTSGYKGKNPYTSTDDGDYVVVGDSCADIAGTNYDWGVYNKISNGGNSAGQWRTLTSDEWYYVLDTRTDASALKGLATVNGVTGMILLPDNWTTPSDITFTSGMNGFGSNTYTISEWAKMEANGAVFLPTAGIRIGTNVYNVGSKGHYWSSSAYGNYDAGCLYFGSGSADVSGNYRSGGLSVRLVRGLN